MLHLTWGVVGPTGSFFVDMPGRHETGIGGNYVVITKMQTAAPNVFSGGSGPPVLLFSKVGRSMHLFYRINYVLVRKMAEFPRGGFARRIPYRVGVYLHLVFRN